MFFFNKLFAQKINSICFPRKLALEKFHIDIKNKSIFQQWSIQRYCFSKRQFIKLSERTSSDCKMKFPNCIKPCRRELHFRNCGLKHLPAEEIVRSQVRLDWTHYMHLCVWFGLEFAWEWDAHLSHRLFNQKCVLF